MTIYAGVVPIGERMVLLNVFLLVLSFVYRFKPRDLLKISSTSKYSVAPGGTNMANPLLSGGRGRGKGPIVREIEEKVGAITTGPFHGSINSCPRLSYITASVFILRGLTVKGAPCIPPRPSPAQSEGSEYSFNVA